MALPTPHLLPEWLASEPTAIPPPDVADPPGLLVVGGLDYNRPAVRRPGIPRASSAGDRSQATRKGILRAFPPIPKSGPEAEDVRKSFQRAFTNGKPEALTGTAASKAEFRRLAAQSRWIHLATHGFFAPAEYLRAFGETFLDLVSGGPSGSQRGTDPSVAGVFAGVALSGANVGPVEGPTNDPRRPRETGILTALEAGTMDLRETDLLFVSACLGGRGLPVPGEGVLSLQRAFAVAGVRTVIAGLWEVDDRATGMLVDEFYKNLWGTDGYTRVGKLKALCNAQLAVHEWFNPTAGPKQRGSLKPDRMSVTAPSKLADGPRISPYFWAAFVLSGDWR